jgi:hypothetical protein
MIDTRAARRSGDAIPCRILITLSLAPWQAASESAHRCPLSCSGRAAERVADRAAGHRYKNIVMLISIAFSRANEVAKLSKVARRLTD